MATFQPYQRILVILPHPDDEAFGLSGTLAKAIENGAHVTYGCLTLGEMGRTMGIPPFANRVTLPKFRQKELEESCLAIGIQDLRLLGFHDKMIEFEDQDKLDETLDALIKEVAPDVIITFYPGYSVHPDHDATGAAVVRTVGRLPANERPPVLCLAFSRNTVENIGEPDVYNDVNDFLEQKVASVLAHRSQFQIKELEGPDSWKRREVRERFGTERFWTYKFK